MVDACQIVSTSSADALGTSSYALTRAMAESLRLGMGRGDVLSTLVVLVVDKGAGQAATCGK